MREDLEEFQRNKVWQLVPKPRGHSIVGTRWVFKNKLDESGAVVRNRSRLVAKGYCQLEGVVPVSTLFKSAFSTYRPLENPQEVHLNLINDSLVILSKEKFLSAINLLVHPSIKIFSPSMADVTSALY
ncbi:uncharacterized mitochondrial protein AtMg00820-like [Lactuca sativa]|uniref:uncharacterized mitochondrial protein AtMg00820-like n=1 Tax=Lactuca sativa TaxID=4236 RepID=UPI000CD930BB|nr:uncharacterized mitochondrial protein AtMg00820-like [Lactuca sativa]